MNPIDKKILFITPSLQAGGSEKIILFLARKMKRLGFKTQLLVIGFRKNKFFDTHDLDVIYLNKERFRNAIFMMPKVIKASQPSIVFSSATHINLFLGFCKLFYPRVKYVARIPSILSKNEAKSNSFFLFKLIKFSLLNNLNHLVFQSNDMKNDFFSTFPSIKIPFSMINNPVIRNQLNLNSMDYSDERIRLITVSSLTSIKGHQRIIESLSSLAIDFRYTIYGDGKEKPFLENLIRKLKLETKVSFGGQIPFTEKLIKSPNTFYLQGSYFEGFPNVMIEALSFGLPVIAFKAPGGHNEIINPGFNGFFAKSNKEFISQIRKSITHKWRKNEIIEDIYDRFKADKIGQSYKTLFESL
jgi:glycosyltransferase involved in cell wall biosynthesis